MLQQVLLVKLVFQQVAAYLHDNHPLMPGAGRNGARAGLFTRIQSEVERCPDLKRLVGLQTSEENLNPPVHAPGNQVCHPVPIPTPVMHMLRDVQYVSHINVSAPPSTTLTCMQLCKGSVVQLVARVHQLASVPSSLDVVCLL